MDAKKAAAHGYTKSRIAGVSRRLRNLSAVLKSKIEQKMDDISARDVQDIDDVIGFLEDIAEDLPEV